MQLSGEVAVRIDLHTHSNSSDGTDSPAELVRAAKASQLEVVGLADHDTFAGVEEALAAARLEGVAVQPALELSCVFLDSSVHLLGIGCRSDFEPLILELEKIRESRRRRILVMCQKLAALGFELSEAEVLAQAESAAVLGRPHVADALVARGYIADRSAAFSRWLYDNGPAYAAKYCVDLVRGIQLVQQAGGAAVIAHPWGRGGGRRVLTPAVLRQLAQQANLDGLEVDHPDHSLTDKTDLALLAERNNLVHTGGSDYHGLGKKNNPLGAGLTSTKQYAAMGELISARGGIFAEIS